MHEMLITYILVILIMVYGFAHMTGGAGPASKIIGWVFGTIKKMIFGLLRMLWHSVVPKKKKRQNKK